MLFPDTCMSGFVDDAAAASGSGHDNSGSESGSDDEEDSQGNLRGFVATDSQVAAEQAEERERKRLEREEERREKQRKRQLAEERKRRNARVFESPEMESGGVAAAGNGSQPAEGGTPGGGDPAAAASPNPAGGAAASSPARPSAQSTPNAARDRERERGAQAEQRQAQAPRVQAPQAPRGPGAGPSGSGSAQEAERFLQSLAVGSGAEGRQGGVAAGQRDRDRVLVIEGVKCKASVGLNRECTRRAFAGDLGAGAPIVTACFVCGEYRCHGPAGGQMPGRTAHGILHEVKMPWGSTFGYVLCCGAGTTCADRAALFGKMRDSVVTNYNAHASSRRTRPGVTIVTQLQRVTSRTVPNAGSIYGRHEANVPVTERVLPSNVVMAISSDGATGQQQILLAIGSLVNELTDAWVDHAAKHEQLALLQALLATLNERAGAPARLSLP